MSSKIVSAVQNKECFCCSVLDAVIVDVVIDIEQSLIAL